ncbi:MAG: hypothetical protein GY913_00675 [Proteobacteria bacterium]|nr:hypothetical protein [Pseudomonadota bacterium]MCP4915411.1 hypothetical protein [Pseudomonadota bacterium]
MLFVLLSCVTVTNENPVEVHVEGCCCCDCCGCDTSLDSGDSGDSGDTGTEEDCANFSPVPPLDVTPTQECSSPELAALDPEVEWAWPPDSWEKPFDNVIVTPVIAPLSDTDGDGVISELDTPSVVFTAFDQINSWEDYLEPGALVVLDGATGDVQAYIHEVTDDDGDAITVWGSAGVALGDLEGDGRTDICMAHDDYAVVCLEGDGTFKFAAVGTPYAQGYPSIADLDGDGTAEVILANQVFDHLGESEWPGTQAMSAQLGGQQQASWWGQHHHAISTTFDLDDDGQLEFIFGPAVYDNQGNVLWERPGDDGFPAVGDFFLDGLPEVVVVSDGVVKVLEGISSFSTGEEVHSFQLVDQANEPLGGPPTIADFDGDGVPEIGVAGYSHYAVYEVDGTPLWSVANDDATSNCTGSSVFDFDGDGTAEVVYADQDQLFLLDGPTGTNLDTAITNSFDFTQHTSGTLFEYPSLADIDGDGSTEIVLASGDYLDPTGWHGVRAIGSESDDWMPSRPVWNQHAYHITNVESDGGIPVQSVSDWLPYNNFRTADIVPIPGDTKPNLYPSDPQFCLDCGEDEVTVYFSVSNDGFGDSDAFYVMLENDGVYVDQYIVPSLASGEAILAGPFVLDSATWSGELTVVADYGDGVDECDELDNTLDLGAWPCH